MRKRTIRTSISLVIALVLGVGLLSAQAKPVLAKRHQDWLSNEVSLLITRPERAAFLALQNDQERDAFVERFWEIRNPDPGARGQRIQRRVLPAGGVAARPSRISSTGSSSERKGNGRRAPKAWPVP